MLLLGYIVLVAQVVVKLRSIAMALFVGRGKSKAIPSSAATIHFSALAFLGTKNILKYHIFALLATIYAS
jgi:hypothetical protein